MKALGLQTFGGPEQLTIMDLPVSEPVGNEVRVRVHAVAVNPTDTTFRAGTKAGDLAAAGLIAPFIPGMDLAGVVDATGPEVTRFRPGDTVMGVALPVSARGGSYAEHAVVSELALVPTPEGMDFATAATLCMNGLTALLILEALDLKPGETLLVTGAAGTLGSYLVRLAKASLEDVHLVADASDADAPALREAGADVVVPRGKDLAQRVLDLHPQGVPAVADAALLHADILPALAAPARIALVRAWDESPPAGVTFLPICVPDHTHRTDLLLRLRDYVVHGELTPRVADIYPADQGSEAHRRLAAGGVRGRLVLNFS